MPHVQMPTVLLEVGVSDEADLHLYIDHRVPLMGCQPLIDSSTPRLLCPCGSCRDSAQMGLSHMNWLKVLLICTVAVSLFDVQPSHDRLYPSATGHNGLLSGMFHIGGSATDIVVQDDVAYVGYIGELAVLDISDVTLPLAICHVTLSANDLACSMDLISMLQVHTDYRS